MSADDALMCGHINQLNEEAKPRGEAMSHPVPWYEPKLTRAVLSFVTMEIYAQFDDGSVATYDVINAPEEVLEMAAETYGEWVMMGGVHD